MLHSIFNRLDALGVIGRASAHCDIPCGVYDPAPALIAAVSVARLMDIMHQGGADKASDVERANFIARCTLRKEEEAEKVKHEIRVIWGDYFKAPLIEKHPEIHALTHAIMQKASACKQEAHRSDAEELVELVNRFAKIFWTTKGRTTHRVAAPFPPELSIVYPDLG